MARGGNVKTGESSNPEAEERRRLRKLAVSSNQLSETPAKASSVALDPSKAVFKHHGKDIIRKSSRKNRFLFSFPGLLAPLSGGKLGELKDLGSKNPILYLDFPQGQMKLFGTIIYPQNRYLTLQFSKGGKNVMCEDYFDTMIVFSDAWWIGNKEENPEEARLDFPEDMDMGEQKEYDFKGGAGSTCERTQERIQSKITGVKRHSPVRDLENESSDSQSDQLDLIAESATRHSARTAGKRFKFAESSSADDAFDLDHTESSDGEEKVIGQGSSIGKDGTEAEGIKASEQLQEISVSATKSEGGPQANQGALVQATISTLFKKKEEKMAVNTSLHPTPSKVSRKSLQEPDSEKVDQPKVRTPRQKGKVAKGRKAGAKTTARKKQLEVSDDEIEDLSDPSQNSTDEEWTA